MQTTYRSFFVGSGMLFLASVELACSDSVGPIPTSAELKIRVDSVAVHVQRSDPNGYSVNVPFTVINSSGQSLFYNGFCFSRWERQDGESWVPVGEMRCIEIKLPLRSIVPYGSQSFAVGKTINGPNTVVPEFAKPGTYRLVILLYLDSRGTRRLPDEVGVSNTFAVVN